MGWEPITYACGHNEEVQMYGKIADRTARAAAAGRRDCPACAAAQAKAADKAAGLPALVGSEKQVSWASTIRAALLKEAEALDAKLGAKRAELAQAPDEVKAAQLDAVAVALDVLRGKTAAKWWIDNRDLRAESIVRELIGK